MTQASTINRAGADGFTFNMGVAPLRGKPYWVDARATLMVHATGGRPNVRGLTRCLGGMADKYVTIPYMMSVLDFVRQSLKADSAFLKVAFHHNANKYDFTCAFECWVRVARIKAYVSMAVPHPKRHVTRLTVEVNAHDAVHYEELLALIDEVAHKRAFDFVVALAAKLDQYQRIMDYLIMCNEVTKEGKAGLVVQKWGGVPGGLQPMPGLERFVPDV